jgi:hypothetical protein
MRGLVIPLQLAREHVEIPEPSLGVLKTFRGCINNLALPSDPPET